MYLEDYPAKLNEWICKQCGGITSANGILKDLKLCTVCEHTNRLRYAFCKDREEEMKISEKIQAEWI